MGREQWARKGRLAGDGVVRGPAERRSIRPCGKVVVRLRPPLRQESVNKETQSTLTKIHGGELKLKLNSARNRRNTTGKKTGDGPGDEEQQLQQQQQYCEEPPAFFQVFTAAASRLVDRIISGGNALLLVVGTPGSGRSRTLWGTLPRQHDRGDTKAGAAVVVDRIEEEGLLQLALADLEHRCRCRNVSPSYHSSTAAASNMPLSSAVSSSSPSRPSFPVSSFFRMCVAEISPRNLLPEDDDEGRPTECSTTTMETFDLLPKELRGIACPSSSYDGNAKGKVGSSSSRSPSKWAMSARDALAGLISPRRSSAGVNVGGGSKKRGSVGGRGGRRRAVTDGSLLASRVLVGVNEVSAEGAGEALAIARKSLRGRSSQGHLVVSAKMVLAGGDRKRSGTAPRPGAINETGELVFVELGDVPSSSLPKTLRIVLARLKIRNEHPSTLEPTTTPLTSSPPATVLHEKTGESRVPKTTGQSGGGTCPNDAKGRSSYSPLWALLSALAGDGTKGAGIPLENAVRRKGVEKAAVAVSGTSAASGKVGPGFMVSSQCTTHRRGEIATEAATAQKETSTMESVERGCPLVVSVVATLRSGDECNLEEKALLEVLAKPSRLRPDLTSNHRPSLGTVPESSWRCSTPGSAATVAAAATSIAHGSVPTPAVPSPSAPPASSSEEASLAASNSFRSHSAASSFSNCGKDAFAPPKLPGGGDNDDLSPCSIIPSKEASPTAEVSHMKVTGAFATSRGRDGGGDGGGDGNEGGLSDGDAGDSLDRGRFSRPATAGTRPETRTMGADVDGGWEVRGRGTFSPRRGDDRISNSSVHPSPVDEADEVAENNSKRFRSAQRREESQRSSPCDDGTLGLVGLSQDDLIERLLQAERVSRYWKAQHSLLERKLASLEITVSRCTSGSSVGGGISLKSLASGVKYSVRGYPSSGAGLIPDNISDRYSVEKDAAEHSAALRASCRHPSATVPINMGVSVGTKKPQPRGNRNGDSGKDWGNGSCGGDKENQGNDKRQIPEETATTNVAESSRRSLTVGVAAEMEATTARGSPGGHTIESTTSQRTFEERRAVFSPNKLVPAPAIAVSFRAPAVTDDDPPDVKNLAKTPLSHYPSRTTPRFAAFSSVAVQAARRNLARNKSQAKRETAAARNRDGAANRQQRMEQVAENRKGRPCLLSDGCRSGSPGEVVSESQPLLSENASSNEKSGSPSPLTPCRALHNRCSTVPSPPAPSPCSVADMQPSTARKPPGTAEDDANATLSRASPSFSSRSVSSFPRTSPSSLSSPTSPNIVSPPTLRMSRAERRQVGAHFAENDKGVSTAINTGGDGDDAIGIEKPSSSESKNGCGNADALVPIRCCYDCQPQEEVEEARENPVSIPPSKSYRSGSGRPVTGDGGSQGAQRPDTNHHDHHLRPSRETCKPAHTGDDGCTHASTSATLPSSSAALGRLGSPPPLSSGSTRIVTTLTSSSPFTSTIPGTPATATASRLPVAKTTLARPCTAAEPSAVLSPCRTNKPESGAGVSRLSWSGNALRKKSVRLATFCPPDSVLEESVVEVSLRGSEHLGEKETKYGGRRNERGGFCSKSTGLTHPPGRVASFPSVIREGSCHGGGGGGGGGVRHIHWRERPPGVGPWPLLEEKTREGRPSLEEKKTLINS